MSGGGCLGAIFGCAVIFGVVRLLSGTHVAVTACWGGTPTDADISSSLRCLKVHVVSGCAEAAMVLHSVHVVGQGGLPTAPASAAIARITLAHAF